MAFMQKTPGAAFTQHLGFGSLPYIEDCTDYYLLGDPSGAGSIAPSLVNQVNPAAPATVIGTPAVGLNYIDLSTVAGLSTSTLIPPFSSTVIMVTEEVRNPSTGAVGGQANAWTRNAAASYFRANRSPEYFLGSSPGAAVNGVVSTLELGRAKMKACAEDTNYGYMFQQQGTALVATPPVAQTQPNPARAASYITFGNGTGTAGDIIRTHALIVYKRALSFAEMKDVFAYCNAEGDARGIAR